MLRSTTLAPFSVSILGVLLVSAFVAASSAYAGRAELTTYYPAPYGEYTELKSQRLAVGDTDGSGSLDAGDMPSRDGDIRLTPQADPVADWPAGTPGQLAYSSVTDRLYHHNGAAWVPHGGTGSTGVMYLACPWVNINAVAVCNPPACPAGWTSVAVSNEVTGVGIATPLRYIGNTTRVCTED